MPSRTQNRKSISVKGITYQWVKIHCDAEYISVSGFIEDLIKAKLDALGIPKPKVLIPKPVKPSPEPNRNDDDDDDEIMSQHFTF